MDAFPLMKPLHILARRVSPHVVAALLLALTLCSSSAHAFVLQDTEGKTHKLADLRGKWIVVNFWATWCAPCVNEIPDLAAFAKKHPDNTLVLGVALDYDNVPKVKAFAKKVGLTYPLVLGEKQSERFFGKPKGLPTTLVYDPAGKQVLNKTGTVTGEQLEELMKISSVAGA